MTAVATWNVGDGPDKHKAHGLDRLERAGASVIALQECGDRQALLRRWCKFADWEMWDGDGSPGAPSVPILWNPRKVTRLSAGTRDATPATKVGERGAGPSTMKAKVWNRVTFDHHDHHRGNHDDDRLVVINGHIVPSVYLPARRRLAREQIETLADMVERRRDQVDDGLGIAAVGDFNMKPSDRLTKPLRELGMTQRTKGATHGRRCIDHVWTLGIEGRVEVVDMPSDHRAAVLTLR